MELRLLGTVARLGARGVNLHALDDPAGSPSEETCDAFIAFAEEIVALPPGAAGPLVRWLAMSGP